MAGGRGGENKKKGKEGKEGRRNINVPGHTRLTKGQFARNEADVYARPFLPPSLY